jgi:hypothetical protein
LAAALYIGVFINILSKLNYQNIVRDSIFDRALSCTCTIEKEKKRQASLVQNALSKPSRCCQRYYSDKEYGFSINEGTILASMA